MLNKLSIKTRLIAVFVIVFALFGLAVATAMKGVFTTSERFEKFFTTNQVRYTAYQTMFADGLLSGIALRNLVLKPQLKKPYVVVPKAISRFDAAYETAMNASHDNAEIKQTLETIQTHWQQSRAAKLRVLELMKNGDVAEATQVLAKEEHPAWQKVRVAVQKLVLAEEDKARELRQVMLAEKDRVLGTGAVFTTLALVIGIVIAILLIRNIRIIFKRIIDSLTDIASGEGDLTRRLADTGSNEVALVGKSFNSFVAKIQTLVRQIAEMGVSLTGSAKEMSELSVHTKLNMNQQDSKIEQVATAMTEMTSTVQEVARSAADAFSAAQAADLEAKNGNDLVNQAVAAITDLANEVRESARAMAMLDENAEQIGGVLDVIRGVAEQTNLLALNAAIEAARAGEQGRGFAVVADEVRTLASRTQESTREIQDMIERLQQGAKSSVEAMDHSQQKTTSVVELANQAGAALSSITQSVSQIAEMNNHIATAAEEQSAVSEEINQNIVSISTLASQAAQSAEHTAGQSQNLQRMAEDLQNTIRVFHV